MEDQFGSVLEFLLVYGKAVLLVIPIKSVGISLHKRRHHQSRSRIHLAQSEPHGGGALYNGLPTFLVDQVDCALKHCNIVAFAEIKGIASGTLCKAVIEVHIAKNLLVTVLHLDALDRHFIVGTVGDLDRPEVVGHRTALRNAFQKPFKVDREESDSRITRRLSLHIQPKLIVLIVRTHIFKDVRSNGRSEPIPIGSRQLHSQGIPVLQFHFHFRIETAVRQQCLCPSK